MANTLHWIFQLTLSGDGSLDGGGWRRRRGTHTPFCIVSIFSYRLPDTWLGPFTLPVRTVRAFGIVIPTPW